MAEFVVKGVESIEFAPVEANGAMPSTGWVKIVNIEEGSVSFNIPEAALTRVRVEDKAGVFAIVGEDGDGASVTGKSLDLDPAKADMLFKGLTTSSAITRFDAPTDTSGVVQLAVRVTSKPWNGFKMVFGMPLGQVVARVENNLTRFGTDFLSLGFTAEAATPTDGSGQMVSPWFYEKVAVTPTT